MLGAVRERHKTHSLITASSQRQATFLGATSEEHKMFLITSHSYVKTITELARPPLFESRSACTSVEFFKISERRALSEMSPSILTYFVNNWLDRNIGRDYLGML